MPYFVLNTRLSAEPLAGYVSTSMTMTKYQNLNFDDFYDRPDEQITKWAFKPAGILLRIASKCNNSVCNNYINIIEKRRRYQV